MDFKTRSGQTEDNKIDIAASPLSSKGKDWFSGWLGIKYVGLEQSEHYHHLIRMHLVLAMICLKTYSFCL